MFKANAICFGLFAVGSLCNTAASADAPIEKPRVFITDSQSWDMQGSAGGTGGTFAARSHGGARPQTAEIIKTFGEKCPNVTINNLREKAAYVVVLDHEGGKGALRHKNKVAVFAAQSGDSIVSKSTLSLGGSVEEACRGIERDWATRKSANATPEQNPAVESAPTAKLQPAVATIPAGSSEPLSSSPVAANAHLAIVSIPDGADIEIDGAFMGNAPSSLQLQPGDHKIVVKKNGYKEWERTLKVSGGEVSIRAELEKN
jgi:PEGA domain-containing protein